METYFDAGQFSTLVEAIDFYDECRSSNNPNIASSSSAEDLPGAPEMEDAHRAIIKAFLEF
ncbi:MAG: hypothetical protein AB8B79_21240 [Granulosicoccus sp.]